MPNVYEKICSLEFERLPEPIKKAYLAPPVVSALVEPKGDGFQLAIPPSLDYPAQDALVPKLGIKSWRDAGTLGVIYADVNIRAIVDPLLQKPTQAQRLTLSAWQEMHLPLKLYLTPYIDFSDVTEVRFLTNPKQCRRISACLRGLSDQDFAAALPRIAKFAADIASHLPAYSHIIDVGYFSNGDIRLVEINPGLTPQDLITLQNSLSS